MAKKVFMIAPFDALTGNLSGEQKLQYAENNNPAYEAPNGTQYARNYRTRYIGARRGRDGMTYFTVKKTTATVLNADTRLTMGTLAAVASIRSAMMKDHAQDYAQIVANLTADIVQGIISGTGKRTIMSLFYEKVADMLVNHKPNVVFGTDDTAVTINNPWTLSVGVPQAALEINPVVWVKFANLFIFYTAGVYGCAYFSVNGKTFVAPIINAQGALCDWGNIVGSGGTTNPNAVALFEDFTLGGADEDKVLYYGNQVYTPAGDPSEVTDQLIANAKYTA